MERLSKSIIGNDLTLATSTRYFFKKPMLQINQMESSPLTVKKLVMLQKFRSDNV